MTLQTILKIQALVVTATFWLSGAALAGGHGDVEKITELLRTYERYGNESNAEGMGSLYADDAVLLPDRFDSYEGAEAITAFYAFAFSALTLNLEFTIDPEDIIVSGETAYAVTSSTGTRLIKETNQTVPEINRELWLFEMVDGDWKIARYAFNKSE